MCDAQEPATKAVCVGGDIAHKTHSGWHGVQRVEWLNSSYVAPVIQMVSQRKKRGERDTKTAEMMNVLGAAKGQKRDIESLMHEELEGQEAAEPEVDAPTLSRQLLAVAAFMADGEWHTLADISAGTGAPEASVSARLRDLRKPKFGEVIVNTTRLTEARVYHYRVEDFDHAGWVASFTRQEAV